MNVPNPCDGCTHASKGASDWMCKVGGHFVPCTWMRRKNGMCGPEQWLFSDEPEEGEDGY